MDLRRAFRLTGLRRLSQAAFGLFFLYLFFQTDFPALPSGMTEEIYHVTAPVAFFFHLDPVVALTAMAAGRILLPAFLWAVPVVLAALLLNRAFCGWVCPFGTLHQLCSAGKQSARRAVRTRRWQWNAWRNAKYAVLLFVLGGVLLAANFAGWLDPFSFLTRSLAVAVHPMLGMGLDGLVRLLDGAGLGGVSDFLLNALRGRVTPFEPRYFLQAFTLGFLFLLALALNRRETRFWCHYVCPLGALLGLLARRAPLQLVRDESACTHCQRCVQHCQGGDQPMPGYPWIPSECHFCHNCVDACPESCLKFEITLKQQPAAERAPLPDLNRRIVLGGLAAGFLAAPLQQLGAENLEKGGRVFKPYDRLIRPPGARPEPDFQALCVRCGACMKACPTNALHPSGVEGGIGALWTPVLVPKIGYCDDRCTLCSQACSTGAIAPITLDDRLGTNGHDLVRTGLAHVDRNRCLPWAMATPCIVCEEVCPTVHGQKAIKLVKETVRAPDGRMVEVQKPVIDMAYCIGCGICENKCPVADSAAIVVTCVGESRSAFNRITPPGA